MTAPAETARAFCAAIDRCDLDAIEGLLDEHVVKHTIGTEPASGRRAVLAKLAAVFGKFERIRFRIINLAVSGDVVLTERIDEFTVDGIVAPVPVMGVFEVREGRIAGWRDYCDLAISSRLMAGEPVGTLVPAPSPPASCTR